MSDAGAPSPVTRNPPAARFEPRVPDVIVELVTVELVIVAAVIVPPVIVAELLENVTPVTEPPVITGAVIV